MRKGQHRGGGWPVQARTALVELDHHANGGRKQTKTRNLLQRMRDRQDQILLFTTDLAAQFSNNDSERDLPPVKTQLKISGCHHSAAGTKMRLRVRGFISAVRE